MPVNVRGEYGVKGIIGIPGIGGLSLFNGNMFGYASDTGFYTGSLAKTTGTIGIFSYELSYESKTTNIPGEMKYSWSGSYNLGAQMGYGTGLEIMLVSQVL